MTTSTASSSPPISGTDAFQLKEKVASLAEAILEKHPRMPTLLREIHTTILQYPEQVTILSEEDVSVIVSGLAVQTQVAFTQAAISGSKSTSVTSKIKKLGVDAF